MCSLRGKVKTLPSRVWLVYRLLLLGVHISELVSRILIWAVGLLLSQIGIRERDTHWTVAAWILAAFVGAAITATLVIPELVQQVLGPWTALSARTRASISNWLDS